MCRMLSDMCTSKQSVGRACVKSEIVKLSVFFSLADTHPHFPPPQKKNALQSFKIDARWF